MRNTGISFACIFGLFAASATGQPPKPNFSGKWQVNSVKSELHSGKAAAFNIAIEQKGASIHVVRTMKAENGKESAIEFTCTTDGKDCEAKGIKVSLWYDGSSLVEMDVSDDLVAKTSMTLGEDGKSLSVTVTYIAPKAEADILVLEKV